MANGIRKEERKPKKIKNRHLGLYQAQMEFHAKADRDHDEAAVECLSEGLTVTAESHRRMCLHHNSQWLKYRKLIEKAM